MQRYQVCRYHHNKWSIPGSPVWEEVGQHDSLLHAICHAERNSRYTNVPVVLKMRVSPEVSLGLDWVQVAQFVNGNLTNVSEVEDEYVASCMELTVGIRD